MKIIGKKTKNRAAIIDDDGIYAEFLALKLETLGFESKTYASADVFYEELCQEPKNFDVILVDRFIGQFDAVLQDFARACKSTGFEGKIFLISSIQQDPKLVAKKEFDRSLKKSPNLDFAKLLDS